MPEAVGDGAVVGSGSPRYDRRRSARVRGGAPRTRLTVYLTPEDRAALEMRSQVSGEAMAKILVDSALHPLRSGQGGDGASVDELVCLLRGYWRQLVGVTTNLNQIAFHANTVSQVPADFDQVVAGIARLRDDIDELLMEVHR